MKNDPKINDKKFNEFVYQTWNGKVVGVDFDGTIAAYDGWKGHEHIGELLEDEDPKGNLERLEEARFMIMIHTCRAELGPVAEYLQRHEIPYHTINTNPFQPKGVSPDKLFADVYIDDRQAGYPGLTACVDDILNVNGYGCPSCNSQKTVSAHVYETGSDPIVEDESYTVKFCRNCGYSWGKGDDSV